MKLASWCLFAILVAVIFPFRSADADVVCDRGDSACIESCCRAACSGERNASAHVRCMNDNQPACTSCCHPDVPQSDTYPIRDVNASYECSGHVPCSSGEDKDGCQYYREPQTARTAEEAAMKLVLKCKYEMQKKHGGTWDCEDALMCIPAESN